MQQFSIGSTYGKQHEISLSGRLDGSHRPATKDFENRGELLFRFRRIKIARSGINVFISCF